MSQLLYYVSLGMMFASILWLGLELLPAAARLFRIRGGQVGRLDPSRVPSGVMRLLYPLADFLRPLVAHVRWPSYRARAAAGLQRAGLTDAMTTDHLIAMKLICMLLAPLLAAQIFSLFATPPFALLAAIGGFFLPDSMVKGVRETRERAIVRALPGAVDVLSLSVEAGLEFLAAIQRFVERSSPGPLRDELTIVLNDIRLGKSRAQALKALAARVDRREVESFVFVLVQADMLGTSIGGVLQQQAARMRSERFQFAERAGAQASQKLLLPLALFIFPAVLIVLVGPVVLNYLYGS